uniref:Transmembrane and ubiquitin-like domain-containing protein 1 n=1 Tax=Salvator merianae TaxID=96440 RepID=A0A8D0DJ51_SALMN
MALIEGVGDEVTLLSALLLLLLLLLLAWRSTRTAPRPDGQPPRRAAAGAEGATRAEGAALRWRGPGLSGPPPEPPAAAASSSSREPEQGGGGSLVLRLKFLNDTERLARVRPEDTVGALKRAQFPGQEQLVRLIYQGRLLQDDSQTLAALHLAHNSVVHCHISQQRPPPSPTATHANGADTDAAHAALNVGSLMVPLFLLMLGALWYFQLQYRHVFTATATTCLAGLTLVFSFVAFAVYRR